MLNFRHIKFFCRICVQIFNQLRSYQKDGKQVVFAIIELVDEKEAQDIAHRIIGEQMNDLLKKVNASINPPKTDSTLN